MKLFEPELNYSEDKRFCVINCWIWGDFKKFEMQIIRQLNYKYELVCVNRIAFGTLTEAWLVKK